MVFYKYVQMDYFFDVLIVVMFYYVIVVFGYVIEVILVSRLVKCVGNVYCWIEIIQCYYVCDYCIVYYDRIKVMYVVFYVVVFFGLFELVIVVVQYYQQVS